jgi:hypothetical protein
MMRKTLKKTEFTLLNGRTFGVGIMTVLSAFTAAGCLSVDPADEILAGSELPGETVPACALETAAYRIDGLGFLPENGLAALDVDGNGRPDDVGGVLHRTFATYVAASTMATWDGHIAEQLDAEPWLLVLERCSDSERAYLRLGRGEDTDGDGAYRLYGTSVRAVGRVEDGAVVVRDGAGEVPIAALFAPIGAGDPGWTAGFGLAGRALRVAADGHLEGELALAFPEEVNDVVAPGLARFFSKKAVDGDSALADVLDANDDLVVTTDELLANPVMQALLQPDVDLFVLRGAARRYEPNQDGTRDAISATFRVTAAPVALE